MVKLIIYTVAAFYVTLLGYWAMTNWNNVRVSGKQSKVALVLGIPPLILFYPIDVLFNLTFGSAMFLAPPKLHWDKEKSFPSAVGFIFRQLTFSWRCDYYLVPGDNRWRSRLAYWVAINLLNDYDLTQSHIDLDK